MANIFADTNTDTYAIAGGRLYLAPYTAAGAPQSSQQRYVGNSQDLAFNVTSTNIQILSSEDGIAELADETTTAVNRTGTITIANVSDDNLGLFIVGDPETVAQGTTPVVDEVHIVVKDGYVRLGISPTNPTGVRDIGSVVVTGTGGTPTYVLDTDYALDTDLGRLHILEAGAIADQGTIEVDYTPVSNSRTRIKAAQLKVLTTEIWFEAANAKGSNRDVYVPKATISPNGDAVFKAPAAQYLVLPYTISVQKPAATLAPESLYIDGRPV